MAKKLIIGNWKMNPATKEEARRLSGDIKRGAAKVKSADMVVCPPFVYLTGINESLGKNKVSLGAQDIFWEISGAYTGEISPGMLKNSGVRYAIIGHSERRDLGETDEMVNKKVKAAVKNSIVPVICVGEKERDSHGYYLATVKKQVENAFAGVTGTAVKNCVVAYEPVWSVGNSDFNSATPETAVEMAIFIRKVLSDKFGVRRAHELRVLYGGSVNAKTAGEFLREKDLAGLLIGRESLDAKKFLAIATAF